MKPIYLNNRFVVMVSRTGEPNKHRRLTYPGKELESPCSSRCKRHTLRISGQKFLKESPFSLSDNGHESRAWSTGAGVVHYYHVND
jgi:hypothetical protein